MKLTIDISPQEFKELTGMDKMEEVQREILRSMLAPKNMLGNTDFSIKAPDTEAFANMFKNGWPLGMFDVMCKSDKGKH